MATIRGNPVETRQPVRSASVRSVAGSVAPLRFDPLRFASLRQRAYLMGLRRARAKAQRARDDLAERFEDVLGEIATEMRGVRGELARLRMSALVAAERDPEEQRWLN